MNEIINKHNFLVVGRAATGIYLILKTNFFNKKVLLPANICYAAVYPVIYSGNIPVFCDINPLDGNLTFDSILPYIKDISVLILPHMYGEPVAEIHRISELCKKNNVLLIEDCASAMGAEINGKKVGYYGDYVVYSTGYSKTIDLGNGGLIASDFPLKNEEKIYNNLPLYNKKISDKNKLFSKAYRKFRNSGRKLDDSDFGEILNSNLSENYLYRLPNSFEKTFFENLRQINIIIEKRRNNNKLFDELLNYDNTVLFNYLFSTSSVPWRKNVFINPLYRQNIINLLLEKNIPVSDWYPVVSGLFGDTNSYSNANKIESSILNFPLLIPFREIVHITDCINQAVEAVKGS